ncbi:hypothetical protein [Kitasatospora sp. NPDC056181]|uniref:hypothetical protein n=1 Tax=Kitasatospora sp. NPDC056181 TaxID=3345737 RepID=UPI0035DAC338
MALHDLRPLTTAVAHGLQQELAQRLRGAGGEAAFRIAPGLGDRELDAVELRFGIRLAADHRTFLGAGLPLGPGWPDWRDGDEAQLRGWLAGPAEGVLFDVRHNRFWYPAWGPRPEDRAEAEAVAERGLAALPRLVPIYGHRYLPGGSGRFGLPVLSVHQTDVIVYGDDLADYLAAEFGVRRTAGSGGAYRFDAPFWSYLLGLESVSTRYDPYATTAPEALEHLRMLALERRIGRWVEPAQLAQAALTAQALGVDSTAVDSLARLAPGEEDRAGELFERVLDELELRGGLPAGEEPARWELLRWWLRLIAEGAARPELAAEVVWFEGWARLGRPAALSRLVEAVDAHDRWEESRHTSEPVLTARIVEARIVEAARELLAGPWPPAP